MTYELAAKNNHLNCLKYAHENGCPWDENTCKVAAKYGHLDCLKYLHENGCPWNKYACASAAEDGHLDCLKYLHENDCPWDKMTCQLAAKNDHLDCLRYAQENGCPDISRFHKYNTFLDFAPQDDDNHTERCCICVANIPKIKFLPCNHQLCCISCTNTLIDRHLDDLICPFCRSKVESVLLI